MDSYIVDFIFSEPTAEQRERALHATLVTGPALPFDFKSIMANVTPAPIVYVAKVPDSNQERDAIFAEALKYIETGKPSMDLLTYIPSREIAEPVFIEPFQPPVYGKPSPKLAPRQPQVRGLQVKNRRFGFRGR